VSDTDAVVGAILSHVCGALLPEPTSQDAKPRVQPGVHPPPFYITNLGVNVGLNPGFWVLRFGPRTVNWPGVFRVRVEYSSWDMVSISHLAKQWQFLPPAHLVNFRTVRFGQIRKGHVQFNNNMIPVRPILYDETFSHFLVDFETWLILADFLTTRRMKQRRDSSMVMSSSHFSI
jgi:hypothetical protein